MSYMTEVAQRAKSVSLDIQKLGALKKNQVLEAVADQLIEDTEEILEANKKDIIKAKDSDVKGPLIDRLMLDALRVQAMANGLLHIMSLDDPIGEVLWMKERPNGLRIGQKRVPLGVVGIIYESRPNVSVDAFGLCFKTGNVTILRGGSDAFYSNSAIIKSIQKALVKEGITQYAVQMVEKTDRETATEMMTMVDYIDVLIPRGGAGLIKAVVENAKVPVIETGVGNCHVYVDESADLNMALDIVKNAKTQRPGVCNALESLVLHDSVLDSFLPMLWEALSQDVELRGDESVRKILPEVKEALEEDWGTEYLDYIMSIKTVANVGEAISHINKYNTKHSEAIITNNYAHSEQFLKEIDAAAVYVNASTRFTDGEMFGFGAEIGISTQKLHARGPMGLEALTSTKYIVYGSGQVR